MSREPHSFDVFLSYNSRDRTAILELAEALRARPLRVWLDDWEVPPGAMAQEALERGILGSRAAAVVMGPSGLGPWERQEMRACIALAVKREMPVIPILLPGSPEAPELPPLLANFSWLDLRGGLSEAALLRLEWGILGKKPETLAGWVPPRPWARERTLTGQLEEAEARLEALTLSGGDTASVRAEILTIRRELREGGRLQAGDSLGGRFRLQELLGKGGFATVWKAYDRQRKELVAVKVLHGSQTEDRTRRERFFRGAAKMAELRHPGIVRVLETELADGGFHFFVMEFVEGGDLRQAVLDGRLVGESVLPVIEALGEALSYAHERRLVHRDVKPANILLGGEGPKLTDFDLVRAFNSTGGTHTQSMLGTFLYAAPEALQDAGNAGAAADVYSLAMTMVFALYGKDLPMDVLRHPERVLARLSCTAGLREVLRRGISWDLAERPGSVRGLCRELADAGAPKLRPQSDRPRPAEEWTQEKDGSVLVYVPGGAYPMGAEDITEAERPIHKVTLSPFWIGKYPITCQQYAAFLAANPTHPKPELWTDKRLNQPRQPVVGVSWEDAAAYCQWAGLSLPSEAQWEAAARGPEGQRFPWGSDEPTPSHANFANNERGTTPVGNYLLGAGPFGTLDQAGNVLEWCEDVWDVRAYRSRGDKPDPVSTTGHLARRALRGGAWSDPAGVLAPAFRIGFPALFRSWFIGFRVCLPSAPEP